MHSGVARGGGGRWGWSTRHFQWAAKFHLQLKIWKGEEYFEAKKMIMVGENDADQRGKTSHFKGGKKSHS